MGQSSNFTPQIKSSKIIRDRDDKPKGFGYVEFTTLDGLKKALEKDGAQFQGRNIRLSVADPRISNNAVIASHITDQ